MTPPAVGTAVPSAAAASSRTGGAFVANTPENRAHRAFGKPVDRGPAVDEWQEVRAAASDGNLTLEELGAIWGLTDAQLRGLNQYRIVWEDGINVEELDALLVLKEKAQKLFAVVLAGSGKSQAEIEKLFDELWALAVGGKLGQDSWNDLMEAHKLDDYKVKYAGTFADLFGKEVGFAAKDGGTDLIDGAAEFYAGLYNLAEHTIDYYNPRTGNPEQDEKQLAENAGVVKGLFSAPRVEVVYLDDADPALLATLDRLKLDKDLNLASLSRTDLLAKIRDGRFGKFLKDLADADRVKDWADFQVAYLREIETAVARGVNSQDDIDRVQASLLRAKGMAYINDILEQGDGHERWSAMIDELARVFQGENRQIALDYNRIKNGETKVAAKPAPYQTVAGPAAEKGEGAKS